MFIYYPFISYNKETGLKKIEHALLERNDTVRTDSALSANGKQLLVYLEPESADVFMNRGQVKLLLDRFDEAVSDLSMACKIRLVNMQISGCDVIWFIFG